LRHGAARHVVCAIFRRPFQLGLGGNVDLARFTGNGVSRKGLESHFWDP